MTSTRYTLEQRKTQIRALRSEGLTYQQIVKALNLDVDLTLLRAIDTERTRTMAVKTGRWCPGCRARVVSAIRAHDQTCLFCDRRTVPLTARHMRRAA